VAGGGKAKVLTDAWAALVAAEGASLPEVPGVHARIRHDVAGAPDGALSYVVTYTDGRITAASIGPADDVDGTFALSYKDAVQQALGQDDLLVAYMQGRAKYVGDVGKVLDLAPIHEAPEFAEFVARVASASDA
jgi:hypothetical protein